MLHRDDYLSRLQLLSDRYVIFFDVDERRAWLVNGPSALLHLVMANLTYRAHDPVNGLLGSLDPSAIRSSSRRNGKTAALEVLLNPTNRVLPLSSFTDTLDPVDSERSGAEGENEGGRERRLRLHELICDLMYWLERTYSHQLDSRGDNSVSYRLQTSPAERLEGFNFLDMATLANPIKPRTIKVRKDGEVWTRLARELNAVTLFGSGFGGLMKPAETTAECVSCGWHTDSPTQSDTLTVLVEDIQHLVDRNSNETGLDWEFGDGYHINVPVKVFERCLEPRLSSCESQRVLKIKRRGVDDHKGNMLKAKKHKFFTGRNQSTTNAKEIRNLPVSKIADVSTGGLLIGEPSNKQRVFRCNTARTYRIASRSTAFGSMPGSSGGMDDNDSNEQPLSSTASIEGQTTGGSSETQTDDTLLTVPSNISHALSSSLSSSPSSNQNKEQRSRPRERSVQ